MNATIPIFLGPSSLITSLGEGLDANLNAVKESRTGIRCIDDTRFFKEPKFLAHIDDAQLKAWQQKHQTDSRFDALMLECVSQFKKVSLVDLSSSDVLVILSTTKGNIELLEQPKHQAKTMLSYSAELLRTNLQNPHPVLIVSNACISGISAALVAKRYLQAQLYKHVLVVGCDVLTEFVVSGFNSFHALANSPCQPFDKDRSGVSLGEACACLLFSTQALSEVILSGGAISNDANHISGPSKTGDELAWCIQQAMSEAQVKPNEIGCISAHGTATPYNDEMESKAFEISGLSDAPAFSLKANFGHTLGAAGVMELSLAAACLKQQVVLPSAGFRNLGVSGHMTVSENLTQKEYKHIVKTGSGFGGCNASVVLSRVD